MKLYHGTYLEIRKPRLSERLTGLDFGKGFYATTSEEQAQSFARNIIHQDKRIFETDPVPTVNIYEFEDEVAVGELNILRFDETNADWFDFVVGNRRGQNSSNDYDVIIGPVADDHVITTIRLFEAGLLDREAAIKAFKTERLVDQVVPTSLKALEFLKFLQSYVVEANDEN